MSQTGFVESGRALECVWQTSDVCRVSDFSTLREAGALTSQVSHSLLVYYYR